jgi:hypothetical protein
MLFGFVMAAVAGFLLAAIPNWTKSLPISAKAGLTLLQPSPGTAQRTIRCQPAVELKLPESDLNYWKYDTPKGVFSIVERASRGVDAYFGQILVAHYASPVQAAEEISGGRHHQLACAPDDGKSLGVPGAVHEWTFVRTWHELKQLFQLCLFRLRACHLRPEIRPFGMSNENERELAAKKAIDYMEEI